MYSAYDKADWTFIKQQSSGISKDANDFDALYDEIFKQFENTTNE